MTKTSNLNKPKIIMKQLKTNLNKKLFFLFIVLGSAMSVQAQQLPTYASSSAQTLCQGTGTKNYQVDWTVESPSGTSGSTYAWSVTLASDGTLVTATTNTIIGNNANSITIDWTNTPIGNYKVKVIETNGTCPVTTLLAVDIIASPSAPTAAAQTLCTASTVANLVATGASGATIKWYAAATGGTALASGTALTGTTYYASQTVGSCESTRTAVVVTIQVAPASAGTSASLVICAGTSVSATSLYAALGGTPATGGTWSATTGGAGTYTYTQAATSPCTTANTATVSVTEQALPTTSAIFHD